MTNAIRTNFFAYSAAPVALASCKCTIEVRIQTVLRKRRLEGSRVVSCILTWTRVLNVHAVKLELEGRHLILFQWITEIQSTRMAIFARLPISIQLDWNL
jgi:hypothetical protein